MSSRLATLRTELARLRRARAAARLVAAWSALAFAVLLALAAVFLLDLLFELAVPQRIVVLALAAAAVGWAATRFTWPLLGIRESEIQTALFVQRLQRIDSELVAALQFEQPEARAWGSPQLAAAVVENVARKADRIAFFQGFPRGMWLGRLTALGGGLAATAVAALVWPQHMRAFANRLFLGPMHYPTSTQIEQVLINRELVLSGTGTSTPRDSKHPQGRPVVFLVQCSGQLPPAGTVRLESSAGARTRLPLKPLSPDERLARLQAAAQQVRDAIQSAAGAIVPPWRDEVAALIQMDAPQAVAPLLAAKTHADLAPVMTALDDATRAWPGPTARSAVFAGELGRLNEELSYKLFVGDAWTEPAAIRMISLPIVELRATPIPPKYAGAPAAKLDPSGRQFLLLEGSDLEMAIECVNRKRLVAAWLMVQSASGARRFELAPRDRHRLAWSLPAEAGFLKNLREELRYEVQVLDEDGLGLETPIRGSIRIRPDQPPTGLARTVHKIVLPTAQPLIEYRASDDFGIGRIDLVVAVERGQASAAAPVLGNSSLENKPPMPPVPAAEEHRYQVLVPPQPLAAERLPVNGTFPLALAPLGLKKGDRVKLTLEVIDYRGDNEQGERQGVAYPCDPLVLEISDEAGVLAAVSESDPRSEERLNEIIQRELGIGETP